MAATGTGFFPAADEGGFVVDYLTPAGSDLTETDRQVKVIEKVVAGMPEVVPVRLDLTDSESVHDLAVEIAGKVDILINTAEYHRPAGIADRRGLTEAQAEMEVNYFGLLRLAQTFAPAMRARAADQPTSAVAWVNLLSVFALSSLPAHGTFSASKAAGTAAASSTAFPFVLPASPKRAAAGASSRK